MTTEVPVGAAGRRTNRWRKHVTAAVLGLLIALPPGLVAPAPALAAKGDPVIFVPGYSPPKPIGPEKPGHDLGTYFGSTLFDTIASFGWNRSEFRMVSFYEGDSGNPSIPVANISRYVKPGGPDFFPSGHTANGKHDRDADIAHLGYHLAWYIYQTYTVHGRTVHVVAHSLGGLMIRSALFETQNGTAQFPPHLLVRSVVTVGTPHDGASDAWLGQFAGGGLQANQMKVPGWGNPFLTHLQTNGAPRGVGGTDWMTIGSKTDEAVSQFSTTTMCCSGVHKVVYQNRGNQQPPGHTHYFDHEFTRRVSGPIRDVCWGTTDWRTHRAAAENVGQMIERGLSGAWIDWPGSATC